LALDEDRLPYFMKTVDTFEQKTTRRHVLSAYVMVGVFLSLKRLPNVRELQEYIRF